MIRDLICLMCPNGCHLKTELKSSGALEVQGSRCDKGLAFVRQVMAGENLKPSGRILSGGKRPSYDDTVLKEIAGLWGIALKSVRRHLMPDGSPERTLFRVVIEDENKSLFVLEEIAPAAYHTKMKIVKTLDFLSAKGMSRIAPYRVSSSGAHIQKYGEDLWQVVPFIPGVPLDREKYLYEAWRANVLSGFLLELSEKVNGLAFLSLEKPFSLKAYIYTLLRQIEQRRPEIVGKVHPVVAFLERDFTAAHDTLPLRFCHGDFHPLNVVWGRDDIRAVIDWEFLGMKPEIYDVANMIGCLGMEHPSSLVSDLVVNLIVQLKASAGFSAVSWQYFVEFLVAMRFAWLSEWLRKEDEEMVALELEYMNLLIENKQKLCSEWFRA
ncbi:MAG: phosphotransferase [Candidatus Omnitrophica bacterium]|nr:phosphotransferase [Candidatus Omnitrophota bacterium]